MFKHPCATFIDFCQNYEVGRWDMYQTDSLKNFEWKCPTDTDLRLQPNFSVMGKTEQFGPMNYVGWLDHIGRGHNIVCWFNTLMAPFWGPGSVSLSEQLINFIPPITHLTGFSYYRPPYTLLGSGTRKLGQPLCPRAL